VPEDVF